MSEVVKPAELTEDQQRKVEEFIAEEEGSFNRYHGWLATFLVAVAEIGRAHV